MVGACMAGGMHDRGTCVAGGMCGKGACMVGACMVGVMHGMGSCTAGETATAADGMHPTGMYSCYFFFISKIYKTEILCQYVLMIKVQ